MISMDASTLESPGTGGRSRFSKALPAPPPESQEASPAAPAPAVAPAWKIPRKPPALPKSPPTAFPPRKESIGARFIPKPLDSPLPAIPAETAPPKKMNSIPRKAVGQPPTPPSEQPQEQPKHQADNESPLSPAKLRRVSSISSILSAYSGTSDGSGHRGSQGSVTTKNSEPSHSPSRHVVADPRDKFFESLGDFSGNPHIQQPAEIQTSHGAVTPPPKDASSGATASRVGGLPANPRSRLPKSPRPEGPAAAFSPIASTHDSSPQPEIWKRRASKSDVSRGVPELSLPAHHGSTAETTTPSRSAALPVAQRDDQKMPPSLSVGQSPQAGISSNASPAAPKSAGLPGRDIRPSPAAGLGGDEDMKKIKHAAKAVASRATGHTFAADDDASINSVEPYEIEKSFNVLPRTQPPTPPQEDTGPRPLPAGREGWSKQHYVPTSPTPFVRRPGSSGLEERGDPALARQLRTGSSDHQSPPASSGQQSRPGSSGHQSHSGSAGRSDFRNKTFSAQESKPDNARGGAEPSQSPQPWTLTSPATLIPPSKHDIFELVTDLNADVIKASPRSRPPAAHNNAAVDNRLSTVGEVSNEAKVLDVAATDKLSVLDKARVEEAVDMFPRQAPMTPSSNGVFAAAPLAAHHFQCLSKHKQWVRAKNIHYSLACATCHGEDREWRAVCKTCSLRVCYPCAGKLTEHGDLSHMLQELQRQQETQTSTASQQPTVVVDTDPAKPE